MVAASVASLIRDRVQFELECIDRMYLNLYVPGLQTPEGLVSFLRQEPGVKVYSTSAIAPMTRAFMSSMERYVTRHRPAMLAPSRAAPRHPPSTRPQPDWRTSHTPLGTPNSDPPPAGELGRLEVLYSCRNRHQCRGRHTHSLRCPRSAS